MKNDDLERDDFIFEERLDDEFEEFDKRDEMDVQEVLKEKYTFDTSSDDAQGSILPDEELDEDGDPTELNFDRD